MYQVKTLKLSQGAFNICSVVNKNTQKIYIYPIFVEKCSFDMTTVLKKSPILTVIFFK